MLSSTPQKMTWRSKLFVSLLCGVLLSLAYAYSILLIACFFVFASMLLLLRSELSSFRRFYGWVFIFCITWNVGSLWWIWNASPVGAVSTIFANSIVISAPWVVYFFLYKLSKKPLLSLVGWLCGFLAMEYFHFNWESHFPWLSIGNIFAHTPSIIQWISITGIAGIALWVLSVNLLLTLSITQKKRSKKPLFITTCIALVVPIIISVLIHTIDRECSTTCQQQENRIHAVIVQPNIDSYVEKFVIPANQQIEIFLRLSSQGISKIGKKQCKHPLVVVWPETCIPQSLRKETIHPNHLLLAPIFQWVERNKVDMLVIGAIIIDGTHGNYQFANTALHLASSGLINSHTKTKLVPGAEIMPYEDKLPFLSSFSIDLGGVSKSLLSQQESTLFTSYNNSITLAPIICYESIFGEYISSYVRKGANVLCIITNDGWWDETPGHIQHLNIARLRAIENRRYILRSANTGVSCYITHQGIIKDELGWNQRGVIAACIPLKKEKTFYVQHTDYLYKWSSILLAIICAIAIFFSVKRYKET